MNSDFKSKDDNIPSKVIRTTLMIPKTIDMNIAYLSVIDGVTKTDMITKALSQFLLERGLQPDKQPKFVIEY